MFVCSILFGFNNRYEEAEVRKKLEERDRQELQKKQEPKDDGKNSAKNASESAGDSKGRNQKVTKNVDKLSNCFYVLV